MTRSNGVCGFCGTSHHEQCARATRWYGKLSRCSCTATDACGQNATPRCVECRSEENVNPQTWRCNDLTACNDTVQKRLRNNPTIRMINELKGRANMAEQAEKAEKAEKVKAEKVQSDCKCGCGTKTGANFAPGHDARMVKDLKEKVLSGQMREAAAVAQATGISEPLGKKLARSITLAREAADKAKAAKEEAEKAKADKAAKAKADKEAAAKAKAEAKAKDAPAAA